MNGLNFIGMNGKFFIELIENLLWGMEKSFSYSSVRNKEASYVDFMDSEIRYPDLFVKLDLLHLLLNLIVKIKYYIMPIEISKEEELITFLQLIENTKGIREVERICKHCYQLFKYLLELSEYGLCTRKNRTYTLLWRIQLKSRIILRVNEKAKKPICN